jgi:hypothetical protein
MPHVVGRQTAFLGDGVEVCVAAAAVSPIVIPTTSGADRN